MLPVVAGCWLLVAGNNAGCWSIAGCCGLLPVTVPVGWGCAGRETFRVRHGEGGRKERGKISEERTRGPLPLAVALAGESAPFSRRNRKKVGGAEKAEKQPALLLHPLPVIKRETLLQRPFMQRLFCVLRSGVTDFLPLQRRFHSALPASPTAPSPRPSPAVPDAGTLLFAALTSFTCGLCGWQLYRYTWKLGILQQRKAVLDSPAMDVSRGPFVRLQLACFPAY